MSATGTTEQVSTPCACDGCGTTVPTPSARVTGAWSLAGESPSWVCPTCTRAALDQIEGVTRREAG